MGPTWSHCREPTSFGSILFEHQPGDLRVAKIPQPELNTKGFRKLKVDSEFVSFPTPRGIGPLNVPESHTAQEGPLMRKIPPSEQPRRALHLIFFILTKNDLLSETADVGSQSSNKCFCAYMCVSA